MNEVLIAIKNRRSIRAFKPDQIKQEELDWIIEAGIYAPSGANGQPWHFTVIQDRSVINHISDVSKEVSLEIIKKKEEGWQVLQAFIERRKTAGSPENFDITYGAPTLIIVSGINDRAVYKHSISACSAAMQNMLIAAESLNVGSVWLESANRCFRREGEAEKIGVPNGYEPLYGIALGYKADNYQGLATPRNRDVVNYIR
jgi:nitroreductase